MTAAEMAWSIAETWKRTGFHGVATGVACYQAPSRVVIMAGGETYTVDVSTEDPPQVEGVSTIHWFPHDLVEWRHDDAYGAKVSDYGVVGQVERVLGRTTLWVYVPGHKEPRQWPAAQCRLLRRNSLNKEGQ